MLNLCFQFNMCVFKILIAFNLIAGGSKITHSSMGDKLPYGGSAQEIEERDDWAILGGEKANITDFPYVAFIQRAVLNKTSFAICGGTLIRPMHVLTAAHCVVDKVPRGKLSPTTVDRVKVRLKSEKRWSGGVVYAVELVIVNPLYLTGSPFPVEGDMAVLRLAKGFKFDESTSPMKVPDSADDPILRRLEQAGEECIVTGWGRSDPTASWEHELMTVKLNLIQTADCGKMTRKLGGSEITQSSMGDKLPHGGSAQEIEESDEWAIVGGEKANIADFPYVAYVQHTLLDKTKVSPCGGTLIRPMNVLTAAHCVVDKFPPGKLTPTTGDRVKVRVKSENRRSGGKVYAVESVFVNPVYLERSPLTMEGDVAVLRLAKGFKFDVLASPIQVPDSADDQILRRLEQAGEECSVAGWGRTDYKGHNSNELMTVKLNLIRTADCGKMTRKLGYKINNDSYVCTLTDDGRDACIGDSGSGLVCGAGEARFVWGVVSFGKGCGEKDSPGVYARVAAYHSFIQSALNGKTRLTTGASDRVASYSQLPVGVIPVVWFFRLLSS